MLQCTTAAAQVVFISSSFFSSLTISPRASYISFVGSPCSSASTKPVQPRFRLYRNAKSRRLNRYAYQHSISRGGQAKKKNRMSRRVNADNGFDADQKRSNRLDEVLRAGLAQTRSKPPLSQLLPIKSATPTSTNPANSAKAARTVNEPTNPDLPDDQLIQILKESIQEIDVVDCSTLLTLMSVAKSLSQLEQAAALVVSKMKLSSADITGPTPNLARLRTWCSYKKIMEDFKRLCFEYDPFDPERPALHYRLPLVVRMQDAEDDERLMHFIDLKNKLYDDFIDFGTIIQWQQDNLERPTFILRKMADIMMSQYMSKRRSDAIALRVRNNEYSGYPNLSSTDDPTITDDDALDVTGIEVFNFILYRTYVVPRYGQTWSTPNAVADLLYVRKTLKMLPWMLRAMTEEEAEKQPPLQEIEFYERPYIYSPWSWQFSKHPIHAGSRVVRNLMYYGPPGEYNLRRRNELMNSVHASTLGIIYTMSFTDNNT